MGSLHIAIPIVLRPLSKLSPTHCLSLQQGNATGCVHLSHFLCGGTLLVRPLLSLQSVARKIYLADILSNNLHTFLSSHPEIYLNLMLSFPLLQILVRDYDNHRQILGFEVDYTPLTLTVEIKASNQCP